MRITTQRTEDIDCTVAARMRAALSIVIFVGITFAATLLVQAIWTGLLFVNLQTTPTLPWSVVVAAVGLWALWEYAGGRWGPSRSREARRLYRRAESLPTDVFTRALAAGAIALGALMLLWIVLFQLVPPPAHASVDGYPLPTVVAVIVMASVLGAVVEEVGLRGYLLTRLERVMPGAAAVALVTIVIAPGHAATQGFVWPVVVWYLVADVVFGALALLTGSIRPGIIVHAVGLLIFFAAIWPADATRRTVALDRADALFWLEVTLCIALAAATLTSFAGLAAATRGRRSASRATVTDSKP